MTNSTRNVEVSRIDVDSPQLGANVQACYYTLDKPFRPFTVFFRAGDSADRCLNNVGQNARMTVSQAGVSCTSVGYVEGKDGDSGFDNCVVNPSIWTLSYKTDTTRESGNTTTRWVSHWLSDNEMTLETYSRGTVVCDSSTLCKSNYFHWDHDLGPAYVSQSWRKNACTFYYG